MDPFTLFVFLYSISDIRLDFQIFINKPLLTSNQSEKFEWAQFTNNFIFFKFPSYYLTSPIACFVSLVHGISTLQHAGLYNLFHLVLDVCLKNEMVVSAIAKQWNVNN